MSKIKRMMALFEGFHGAHGTHGKTDKNNAKGGKREIKKSARTVREPVSEELWSQHIAGQRPIGIIPIREDHHCVWGCIDIDKYDLNLGDVVTQIESAKLPLVVCRTKSGGAHAYLFLTKPQPAEDVRQILSDVAASLGYGGSEIFPKQSEILSDRGDLGNWLNMPYLGGDDTERYGVKSNGLAMSFSEFLGIAEGSKVSISDIKVQAAQDSPLSDGPPCLQHLTTTGFPEGTRNNGLFALGVYAKLKHGDDWRKHLEEMNREYMNPPLSADEVTGVIKGLEKKDYKYGCKQEPLCSFCDSALCKSRKFGVGIGGAFPDIKGLSKLATDPPIWFVDIDETRVELTTDQLMKYQDFQRVCLERLDVMYMPMKAEIWQSLLNTALQSMSVIEAPPEMSIDGQFMEELENFLKDRHSGRRAEDINLGRPFFDESDGLHWFRLRDIMSHLDNSPFKSHGWGRNKVGQKINTIGGKRGKHIAGKYVNLYWVSDQLFEEPGESPLPEVEKSPI